jgi:hypothetical protein
MGGRIKPDDIGFAFEAEIELQSHLGGTLHLLGQGSRADWGRFPADNYCVRFEYRARF